MFASTKGWFSKTIKVSYAVELDEARCSGVSPPLVTALTLTPHSNNRATHKLLFHLLAECNGCQSSLVNASVLALCLSNNSAI